MKFNCYKTSPCTCTLKAYCIFDICTVWVGHNLLTSFISKLSQVYTQANSHGEVAKIQPAWSSQRNHKLCAVMLTEFYISTYINWVNHNLWFTYLWMGKFSYMDNAGINPFNFSWDRSRRNKFDWTFRVKLNQKTIRYEPIFSSYQYNLWRCINLIVKIFNLNWSKHRFFSFNLSISVLNCNILLFIFII